FQAEDGIRDATVTGVQTCALPISALLRRPAPATAAPRLAPDSAAPRLAPDSAAPRRPHMVSPARARPVPGPAPDHTDMAHPLHHFVGVPASPASARVVRVPVVSCPAAQ